MRKAELAVNLAFLLGIPVMGLAVALFLAGPIAAIVFVCLCFAIFAVLLARSYRRNRPRKH
jgi:hypothetical protein